MHYRNEYGARAWIFLTIFFYYMIIHLHMNHTLYESFNFFLQQQYFFMNLQAYLEGDNFRMPDGCYEYLSNRIILIIYIIYIYIGSPFFFIKKIFSQPAQTLMKINVWAGTVNERTFTIVLFYWEVFKLRPKNDYVPNMGVFFEHDNADVDQSLKKTQKKTKKKKTEENPEIPTVQIGGVSWEYLRLKKKNLKQEKIDYQQQVEDDFGFINSFRSPTNNHFIEIKKKLKNYKETELLKKWKKELSLMPDENN